MLKKINTLNWFDWLLISGIVLLNIIYSVLEGEADFTGVTAAVSGVVCVVLVAKGNILNYIFGVINVSLYAWISWKAQLYGDAFLNALYYLPMQFAGWFLWFRKRESEESVTIVTRRMNVKERVWLAFISVTLTLLVGYLLSLAGDPQPYKDSATTVLSVIAMYIMVKAYMEQWALWVIVNMISIIMWLILYYKGAEHAMLMVIMWVAYLANSINGWIVWHRLSKHQR